MELAREIVEKLAGDLYLGPYRDEYRERVEEMVRAKLSGEVIRMTRDGHLRAPVFLRIREDKPVDECSIDQMRLKGRDESKNDQ